MSEEQEAVVETVADEVVTATNESEEVTEPVVEKTFTQEELDKAIGKRLAREQRKWDREHQPRQEPAKPENFTSDAEYIEALAEQKAERLIAEREQKRQQSELLDTYHDKEEEARDKYIDFEQVAYNPSLKITDVMAQTIQASDIGPEVAYYLGKNPKEADRISKLAPIIQAKEIGRLESKIEAQPSRKTSSAPSPIAPIGGKKAAAFKSPADMSDDEYRVWSAKNRKSR